MFCKLPRVYCSFENSKWPPFLGSGKFFENCRVHSSDTLWVENFNEIALSRMVKEIEANLCFAIFQKFKMAAFFGEGKMFCKLPRVYCSDTLWVENFNEITLFSHG